MVNNLVTCMGRGGRGGGVRILHFNFDPPELINECLIIEFSGTACPRSVDHSALSFHQITDDQVIFHIHGIKISYTRYAL